MFISSTLRRLALAGIAVLGLCSLSVAGELPAFKTGFIFTTHHSPFQVAASRGEAFRDLGVYLKPLVERESYELIKDGKPIAILRGTGCAYPYPAATGAAAHLAASQDHHPFRDPRGGRGRVPG